MCRPVLPEPQTTAFEDERHARLRALSRSVGTADGVAPSRLGVGCLSIVLSVAARAGQRQRTSRALLKQRRAAVARQLRRLAIELTDIDRQLDEIEQSER